MLESIVHEITEWLWLQPLWAIYLTLFVICYTENVFPPIPGDLFIIFGGYLYAEQMVGLFNLLWITSVGSVLGFMTLYAYGRYWGEDLKSPQQKIRILRYLAIKYYDKVERWMNRWGQGVIIANRFLTGTRTVISLIAGVSKTHLLYTTLSALLSAVLWNLILIGLGWWIKEKWEIIGFYIDMYGLIIFAGTVIFGFALWFYFKRRKARKSKK